MMTRREFLGSVTAGACTYYFSQYQASAWAAPSKAGGFFDKYGPIDRTLDDHAPAHFFGDEFERAHRLLWDIPGYLSQHPEPIKFEKTDLVIVGGGLSGLFTAFAMRKSSPLVLEQASRFGGNAKGQAWRGIDFGLGSAYMCEPSKGDLPYQLFKDAGLASIVQRAPELEPVAVDGKAVKGFWSGAAEPAHKATYAKYTAFLKRIFDSAYPAIPSADAKGWSYLQSLDSKTLRQALEAELGPLPPLLGAAIESYCWSSFNASATEISAASGLSFLSADLHSMSIAPAGNAGIAEHLIQQSMKGGVSASNFRANSTVLRLTVEKARVKVLYADSQGALKGIDAKAAVMACPKFVAAKLIADLEPSRVSAIAEIEYRPYLTAAVLIGKPIARRMYELFLIDSKNQGKPTGATDVVCATLGQPRARNTVLTLYRPLPQTSARAELMNKDAWANHQAAFSKQIQTQILPLLGLKQPDIVDIRLARWGHAFPIPKQGIFNKGLPQILRQPFKSRVFFIEQDNWLTPAVETGAGEVALQEALIRAALV